MRRGLLTGLTIAAAFLPAVVTAAPDATDDRAVVLPFVNLTGEKSLYWIGEAFALGVTDHLLAAGLDAVDSPRRRDVYREMGLDESELPTLASTILLSRRLNAGLVIQGELRWQEPHRIEIRGRLIRAAVPAADEPIELSGDLHDLYDLQRRFAGMVLPFVRGRTGHAQVPPAKALEEVPLPSFEAYVKAMATDDVQDRRSFLDRALEADPFFSPALIERARVDLDDGRAQEALIWLDRIDPEKMAFPERYWLARGDAAAAQGDRGSALDLYERALTRRDWPLAHFRVAAVLAQQGKLMEARQEVEAGLLVDPGHPLGIELREALSSAHPHRTETPS